MTQIATFLVAFAFLCLVSGEDSCAAGQSNYTRTDYESLIVTGSRSVKKMEIVHGKNCGVLETIRSWFRNDECDTRSFYRTVYETFTKVIKTQKEVVECCPGYRNYSGVCETGCPKDKYGDNCTQDCSCYYYCDSNGACMCPAGKNGTNCTEDCDHGYYGYGCLNPCLCENNSSCNAVDGTCNCTEPGWTGYWCHIACNRTYGVNCELNCTCNENQTCSPVDGTCTCKPGWMGEDCTEECDGKHFGINCTDQCTCVFNNTMSCDRQTGDCICHSGYTDPNCSQVCPFGLFGDGCYSNCSEKCIGTSYCDPKNGSCICLGKRGENCTEECDAGTFGPNCNFMCNCSGSNMTGSCAPYNGTCYCKPGWHGTECMAECPTGSYGDGCSGKCSEKCVGTRYCSALNGTCQCLGKQGENCSEVLQSHQVGQPTDSFPVVNILIGIAVFVAVAITVTVIAVISRRRAHAEKMVENGIANIAYEIDKKHVSETNLMDDTEEIHNYDDASLTENQTSDARSKSLTKEDVIDSAELEVHYEDAEIFNDLVVNAAAAAVKNKELNTGTSKKAERQSTEDNQDIYDSTEDKPCNKSYVESDYDRLDDGNKCEKRVRNKAEKTTEEEDEYDSIDHGIKVRISKRGANYTSVSMKKDPSIQEDDDADTYNVLNEDSTKQRTVAALDPSYHHVDFTNKTVDGTKLHENFYGTSSANDAPKIDLSDYHHVILEAKSLDGDDIRSKSQFKSVNKQSVEEKASVKAINIESDGAILSFSGAILNDDVIYDECESETNYVEDVVRKPVTDSRTNPQNRDDHFKTNSIKGAKANSEKHEVVEQAEKHVINHYAGKKEKQLIGDLTKKPQETITKSKKITVDKSSKEDLTGDGESNHKANDVCSNVEKIDAKTDRSNDQEVINEEVPDDEVPGGVESSDLYYNVDSKKPNAEHSSSESDNEGESENLIDESPQDRIKRERSIQRAVERRKVDYEEYQL